MTGLSLAASTTSLFLRGDLPGEDIVPRAGAEPVVAVGLEEEMPESVEAQGGLSGDRL